MSRIIEQELLQVPQKPYEKTDLYKDSVRLKQLMYHVVSRELDKRARYRQGEDLAKHCDAVCRYLIVLYMETDQTAKYTYVTSLLTEAIDTMVTLRAIDNSNVHMTKESYTAMLGILVQYIIACKSILHIQW